MRVLALTLTPSLLVAVAFGLRASPDLVAEPAILAPGTVLTRALRAGESHRYRVELREGEFFQATVEQRGVDVTLAVDGPDGGRALEADSPTSENGPEPLAFVARATGAHVATVSGSAGEPAAGAVYEMRVEAVRAPTAADLLRVEAAWSTSEAVRLVQQGGEQQVAQSHERLEHALQAWTTLGEPRMQMWTENALGFLQGEHFDRHRESTRHYQAALAGARALRDEAAAAHILIALGQSYRHEGQLDAARETLEEALILHRAAGRGPRVAWVLTLLGVIADLSGEAQGALDQLGEAERLYREAGDRRNAAVVRTKIGATQLRLGEYELAVEQYRTALPAFEAGERRFAAQAFSQIGVAQVQQGDRVAARASYGEALRIHRTLGNRSYEAYTALELAKLDREEGQLPGAQTVFAQAVTTFRASGDRAGEAAAQCEIGETRRRLGDREAARTAFHAALRIAPARNVPLLLCVEPGLARLSRDEGDLRGARAHAENAVEAVESQRASVISPHARASALASSQTLYELLIDVRMRQHQAEPRAGHQAGAFEAAERARARSLLELLAAGPLDIRAGADAALLAEERTLRQRLNARAEALEQAQAAQRTERAQALDREVLELTGRLTEIETRLRRSSPRYEALMRPRALALDEVRAQALDAETVLLEYAFGEDDAYLFVVSRQALTAHRLGARSEIERAARRVHELLSAVGADASGPAAIRELSALVLPRELEQLTARRLLLVAPGALQFVPFSVLTLGGPTALPLMARFELVSPPSASVAATLRAESRPLAAATRSVAVFADPVFDATDPRVRVASQVRGLLQAPRLGPGALTRLPFSRQEAAAILAAAPAHTSLSALGFDANRGAATGAALADYRVVHFATHALLDPRRPELSSIVLSLVDRQGQRQDGLLRLHDIYNLRLGADLVVLSGCRTALGRDMKGEGLVGLTRGFMYAGAPRVVASLWPVDDLATSELMKRFYRAMFVQHLRPAAALRAAQQELAASRPWGAPYYWAAFVLHGDWS